MNMIITIDGPVGTGKSTIAKRLADKLGFVFFDTGAMYRCFTYGIIKNTIDLTDAGQLDRFLRDFDLDIRVLNGAKRYFFEGSDITDEIRGEAVTSFVSEVSSFGPVREKLVAIQRKLGHGADAVFEGRDMGTVVFPDAELKIFLMAKPEVRAQRRFDELRQKYLKERTDLKFDQVLASINKRDAFDSAREISPLKQADDAYLIDSSGLSIEEVVEEILGIKEKRGLGRD
jgi:cytidylate kinase